MIYQTLSHNINEQALTVCNENGKQLKVRPKTCQLLIVLLKSANTPINKQNLLSQVWPNTVVSEQVVFQSINEIRQLFPNQDVIKTIPQQGYVWLPEVTSVESTEPQSQAPQTDSLNANKSSIFSGVRLAIACLFLLTAFAFFTSTTLYPSNKTPGSIVVLPTLNQVAGNDHAWVRLGMMDQVISRLNNSNNHQVLQTDYVLEVLQRADIALPESKTAAIRPADIQQIFKVSGAELIVHSTLGGSASDYQLIYVFYYRNGNTSGALVNQDLQAMTDKFTQIIAQQLDNQNEDNPSQQRRSDFDNELLVAALESNMNGNYELSKSLLTSIVIRDENNLTAQRLLVDSFFRLKQFEQGKARLDIAIPIAEALNDDTELTQLLFSKSLYYYVTMNDSQSLAIAKQALSIATKNNDWLYMAYLKDQMANIAINQKDYQEAARLVHEGKAYHKVLRCPVGESASWAKLAQIAKMNDSKSEFHHALDEAIKISTSRELHWQTALYQQTKAQWL
ncbi:winged helix-turn-helix domain-containing protein [Psychrosphaera aestuarii]|uniref:winged helix-turn-helix domain-containing protein n=1 Tax=Psychrosphaera aestuarii TaxID=1266052 RepID=UPI001B325259|nr:winged helix-turn-helix domain-containing protein [Psychrosphaera aestuarii]